MNSKIKKKTISKNPELKKRKSQELSIADICMMPMYEGFGEYLTEMVDFCAANTCEEKDKCGR